MVWALSCDMRAEQVEALFAAIDKSSETRVEFTNSISRDAAISAVHAILWAYESRPSDTAACYAWTNLWGALRVDMASLKFLPAPVDTNPTGGGNSLAPFIGSAAGEAGAPVPDTPNPVDDGREGVA